MMRSLVPTSLILRSVCLPSEHLLSEISSDSWFVSYMRMLIHSGRLYQSMITFVERANAGVDILQHFSILQSDPSWRWIKISECYFLVALLTPFGNDQALGCHPSGVVDMNVSCKLKLCFSKSLNLSFYSSISESRRNVNSFTFHDLPATFASWGKCLAEICGRLRTDFNKVSFFQNAWIFCHMSYIDFVSPCRETLSWFCFNITSYKKAAFQQKYCSGNLQDIFLTLKKLTICFCKDKTFSSTCPRDNQRTFEWYDRSMLNVLSSYWSIWRNCRCAFPRM